MSTILIEAYETGGRIIDVLDVGVDLFTSLDEYREERDAQMRPYLLYYKAVLMWAAVMEALFGGLVAGKISEGRISVGLIHSVLLLVITVVFFNVFSV